MNYKFDNFIEYYDYEECEQIIEEDDELQYERKHGDTGSESSDRKG